MCIITMYYYFYIMYFKVLDKGPNSTQAAILEIIFCIVQYLDKDQTPPSINTEVLRVVASSIELGQ